MSFASKVLVLVLAASVVTSCGFRRKKYENPITKDTQQPDKALYDKAINDIEKSRFEVARITLNTLINTYDTSEYLAKAKLAIADSWYREGSSSALAQAEAEYKDFILFYPMLEESAESQEKICMIHLKQMEKPDRDLTHAMRAEDECRQLLTQFPNSKFAPRAQQLLREVQEVIAESEYRVGAFYHNKGSHPAAANRLEAMVNHYGLYSKADEALWKLGDSFTQMGPRFRDKAGEMYSRLVKDYPLSAYVGNAKEKLTAMEMPIPEADPVAYARMKYEQENATKPGFMNPLWGVLRKSPDVHAAAKSGTPAMTAFRPSVPVSVPTGQTGVGLGSNEVTVGPVQGTGALENEPEARKTAPGASAPADGAAPAAGPEGAAATPANNGGDSGKAAEASAENGKKASKKDKKKKNEKENKK